MCGCAFLQKHILFSAVIYSASPGYQVRAAFQMDFLTVVANYLFCT